MLTPNTLRVLATSALVLSLAGCGSGDPGPDTEQTSAPPATSGGVAPPVTGGGLSNALQVLVLGDSTGKGGDVCGGCTAYADLYAEALQAELGVEVEATNLSTTAAIEGSQLVTAMHTNDTARQAVAKADILIINIGQNDTPWLALRDPCDGPDDAGRVKWSHYTGPCMTELADRHGTELADILAEAKVLRGDQPTVQIVTTTFNDWTGQPKGVPVAAVEPIHTFKDEIADTTCRAAEAAGAACVDVYHAFNGPDGTAAAGDLLADDYLHLSQAGHQVIADLLMEVDVSAVAPN